MEKCALHCIGKYIRGSGLDDCLLGPQVFGSKVLESLLSGTNYGRALQGRQILQCSIEAIKWRFGSSITLKITEAQLNISD